MAFEHGTRLTFASLDRDSDTLARNLATLGVVPGDRVMAILKNRIEFMLAMIAVQKLGAVYVPINTELKGAFLQHQMRNSEPRVVFLETDIRDAFDKVEGGDENLTATVYVAGDAFRLGVGRALLGAVIDRCTELGFRQMIAVIGDSGNAGSIGLHAHMGFELIGVMPAVGFKFGRWVDTVRMQRALGPGAAKPPDDFGAAAQARKKGP